MAYLLDHPNVNAPHRGDGQYWGHPTRRGTEVSCGVIHTAENLPDITPPDTGAESVAKYQSYTKRPSSYHDIVDSDSWIECLPGDHTAFGTRGQFDDGGSLNDGTHHLSMATQAHKWSEVPVEWAALILKQAAIRIAEISTEHNLPFRLLTGPEVRQRIKGWTTHARLDPGRRSDPGISAEKLRALLNEAKEISIRGGKAMSIVGSVADPLAVTTVVGRVPFWTIHSNGEVSPHNGARVPTFDVSTLNLNAPITGGFLLEHQLVLVAAGDSGTFALNLQ